MLTNIKTDPQLGRPGLHRFYLQMNERVIMTLWCEYYAHGARSHVGWFVMELSQ